MYKPIIAHKSCTNPNCEGKIMRLSRVAQQPSSPVRRSSEPLKWDPQALPSTCFSFLYINSDPVNTGLLSLEHSTLFIPRSKGRHSPALTPAPLPPFTPLPVRVWLIPLPDTVASIASLSSQHARRFPDFHFPAFLSWLCVHPAPRSPQHSFAK